MDVLTTLEGIAVVLAIAYLVLAAREHIACWACALGSTAIYIYLFWDVRLLMESALNVYYLLMALYGWWHWRAAGSAQPLAITRFRTGQHLAAIALVLVAAAVSGSLLAAHSDAAWPYVDSFTTWGAVVTTWMVTRKILENWLYWLVVDGVSIPLYVERGLHLTAALFAIYLVIVVFGWLSWRRRFALQHGRAD